MIDLDAMLAEAAGAETPSDLDAVQARVMARLSAPERPGAGRGALIALALGLSLGGGVLGGWPLARGRELPRTIGADDRYAPSVLLGADR